MSAEKRSWALWVRVFLVVFIIVMGSTSLVAAATPFTINCISAWPKSTHQVEFFNKDFTERIQQEADKTYPGQLKLVYKGGPEIMAQNEQIVAVGKGVVDLLYTSPAYYVSQMPELDIWNITTMQSWEERAVGLNDYVDQLHNQKTNTHFLVRSGSGMTLQFGLLKPISKLDDLKGLSVRANPSILQLAKDLGMNPVNMPPSDAYTALERGVVQGHAMPAFMMRSFGVDKVTKVLLFPGFFDAPNVVIVNLDTWKKLPKHLQEFMTEQADIHAHHLIDYNVAYAKKELDSYKAAGMIFLDLPKTEGDKLVKLANDGMVKVTMEKAPNETKKFLEFFAKKPKK
jgi:TRAP-type transport system periplasmic protein